MIIKHRGENPFSGKMTVYASTTDTIFTPYTLNIGPNLEVHMSEAEALNLEYELWAAMQTAERQRGVPPTGVPPTQEYLDAKEKYV
jgi:hypothetical protein|tara:strand:- start:33 stop:290 length:258 start_codon:yes stop_codon:yes gene_type:complete